MFTIPTFIFVVLFIFSSVTGLLSVVMWMTEEKKCERLQKMYEESEKWHANETEKLKKEIEKLNIQLFIKE